MCKRCQICGPIVAPTRPTSSSSSRCSASTCVSPGSSPPPGNAHRVAVGNSKRTSSTRRSVSMTKALTASRMRSACRRIGVGHRGQSTGESPRPVVEHPVHLVHALARLAQRQLLRVARRHPDVPAQRFERGAVDACLEHLRGGALAGFGLDDVGRDRLAGFEVTLDLGDGLGDGADAWLLVAHDLSQRTRRRQRAIAASPAPPRVGPRPVLELVVHVLGDEEARAIEEAAAGRDHGRSASARRRRSSTRRALR